MFSKFPRKSKQKMGDDPEPPARARITRSKFKESKPDNNQEQQQDDNGEEEEQEDDNDREEDREENQDQDNKDNTEDEDEDEGEKMNIDIEESKQRSPHNNAFKHSDFSLNDLLKWDKSEESLVSMLKLQIERERSQQEQLKLQNIKKTMEVLNMAINYKIPNDSIALIFNNRVPVSLEDAKRKLVAARTTAYNNNKNTLPERSNTAATTTTTAPSGTVSKPYTHTRGTSRSQSSSSISSSSTSNQPTTSVFKVNIPQQVQYQFHQWHPSIGSRKMATSPDVSTASSIPGGQNQSFMTTIGSGTTTSTLMSPSSSQNNISTSQIIPPLMGSPTPRSPLRRSVGHRRGLSDTSAFNHNGRQSQFMGPSLSSSSPSKISKSTTITSNINHHNHHHKRGHNSSHSRQGSIDGTITRNFVFPLTSSPATGVSVNSSISQGPTISQPSPGLVPLMSQFQQVANNPSAMSQRQLSPSRNPIKGHKKAQSKTDVNFMISPPDEHI
ncbi:hypothetical protein DASC09_022870 [Saccharomycopsis crataegensis]|uniref:Uncharacterized protein n=1 Tax=Saccharomycopsis crataegensis TaxID=43959 RepID=A0AAV5QJI6_9ASCO|nr:hypothetical protein DASC09_022870 [Saccharomycopsis crataegensis]